MTGINRNAENARENARHGDGKFGAQHRPEGVSLNHVSPGDSSRLFDRDLTNLHKGLDEGVAIVISDDSDSAGAGLTGVIETPPYGEPGNMWAVVRIDQPGHPDHDALRSVPADDLSPASAPMDEGQRQRDEVNIDSTTGEDVFAVFNDDDTLDIESGFGAVRISMDDIAKLAAAADTVKKRRHRASIVEGAPVELVREGLPPQGGTVVGIKQNGDYVDVRYDDGRVLSHAPERLRLVE